MTGPTPSQGDLFVLDSPLLTEVRGEHSLMAYPFFALAKSGWKKSLMYKTDTVSIEIGPGPRGVATIYDKEILLYIASLLVSKMDAGERVAQDFYFTAHDLFRVTGVNGSARSYTRLADALERLQGTQIKTNIEAGGEGQTGFFSWLSEATIKYTKTRVGEPRMKGVQVRLCDWLYRAILKDRRVLEYSPDYFQLGPVERRLYEVARSTCIDGPVQVDLDDLRLQLGYQNSLKHFRHVLRGIAEADSIPDYSILLNEPDVPAASGPKRRVAAPTLVTLVPKSAKAIAE
ncbi:replication initiator protein A [Sphingomonas carotinifaciens]|uniref:Replication initiator protein A n=2 Tax=Sphingomonas carotinifaciens TaxID=1166323 RepID=A0A1G7PZZ1_9SPHN|nr:replication initiator protein A [Sphingomonas carotinifaciens]MBB4087560.1 plasmid replication initiation protein [Sphingomonas carotinifaciens]SDF91249.1 Replication initiator protein A [Sphingomonas carotinifaciens]